LIIEGYWHWLSDDCSGAERIERPFDAIYELFTGGSTSWPPLLGSSGGNPIAYQSIPFLRWLRN